MLKERFGTSTSLYHNLRYNKRLQLAEVFLGSVNNDVNWDRGKLQFYYGLTAAANQNPLLDDTTNNGNLVRQWSYVPLPGGGYVTPQLDDYAYDGLNRITSITEAQQNSGGGWTFNVTSQTFTYDRWGNRLSVSGYNAQSWNATEASATNRLKLTSGTSCSGTKNGLCYDAAGNLIFDNQLGSAGDRTYDAEGRMTSAAGGGLNKYVYDADGKRVRRQVGAQQFWQVYGIGGELVAEYLWDGTTATLQKEYGYRSGDMLIVAEGATVRWLVKDHLGTSRMIADQTGSLSGMRRHDYLPFGEENFAGATIRTAANGYQADNVRQKFTGKERDNETGLDYFLARYHSSAQGRFTSVDPGNAGAVPEDPQSWNGYAYARSNPVLYTDPDGRSYIVCGPMGGGSCGLVTDLEFNLDRDGLEAQGLQFTGSRQFFEGGSIIYEGEVLATYQQISIDDRAKELAYWMQVEFRSVSMYERALVNGVFAGILGLRFGRGGNRGTNFIQEITAKYGIFQCKECARELLTELRKNGIKARVLKMESKVSNENIFSDKVGGTISTNGNHWAIEVNGMVFDNIHKQGIPFEQWVKDFQSPRGVRIFTDITNEILK